MPFQRLMDAAYTVGLAVTVTILPRPPMTPTMCRSQKRTVQSRHARQGL